MDCLGAAESPKDYVVAGTAATEMHGCAEALWQEDMVSSEWITYNNDMFFSLLKSFLSVYRRPFCLVVTEMLHLVGAQPSHL